MTDTKPEKYQLLPELRPEEFEALKQDIAERGVIVPVVVDEFGAILDGHNRARACRQLGINDYPVEVRSGLSEADKRVFARKLNVLRRHLTRDQVRQLIGDQLRDNPEWSNNRVAGALGVDDKTVASVRSELAATSEIPKLDRTVGADGKARKASRQSRKGRPALEDWDEEEEDDDEAGPHRRGVDPWNDPVKQAKFRHALDLIKHGVDPNSEEVGKLFREAAVTIIKSPPGGAGYRVFSHCTEYGERDWYLFVLFLSKERNWWPDNAGRHVEYLSQKQFMDPDEWLGQEGRRFRDPGAIVDDQGRRVEKALTVKSKPWMPEPSDEFKRAWAAFKEANSGRSQAEIIAETDAIYKERGPASEAPTQPKRKRRKPAPERVA